MAGSVSLLGGHGTAAAWGAIFAEHTHLAPVLGLASATFGLIAGGVIGGPVGRYLIERYRLRGAPDRGPIHETAGGGPIEAPIDVPSIFASFLLLAVAIAAGDQIGWMIDLLGLTLPAFVTALFAGILIGNLGPRLLPRLNWPIGSPALSLLGELALNLFLTRALMSLDLWTLSAVAGPLLLVLTLQVLAIFCCAASPCSRRSGATTTPRSSGRGSSASRSAPRRPRWRTCRPLPTATAPRPRPSWSCRWLAHSSSTC